MRNGYSVDYNSLFVENADGKQFAVKVKHLKRISKIAGSMG